MVARLFQGAFRACGATRGSAPGPLSGPPPASVAFASANAPSLRSGTGKNMPRGVLRRPLGQVALRAPVVVGSIGRRSEVVLAPSELVDRGSRG